MRRQCSRGLGLEAQRATGCYPAPLASVSPPPNAPCDSLAWRSLRWRCARWALGCLAAAGQSTKPTPVPAVNSASRRPGVDVHGRRGAVHELGREHGRAAEPRSRRRPSGHELGDGRAGRRLAHKPAFDARDPNAYPAMAGYDALIRGLAARHIGIDLALIGPPPRWAEGQGAPSPSTQPEWKPDAGDVRGLGARGRDPLQRPFHSPGRVTSAAADQLLVDLERAKHRDQPRARGDARRVGGRGRAEGCTAVFSTGPGARCTRPATATTASSSASSRPPA